MPPLPAMKREPSGHPQICYVGQLTYDIQRKYFKNLPKKWYKEHDLKFIKKTNKQTNRAYIKELAKKTSIGI